MTVKPSQAKVYRLQMGSWNREEGAGDSPVHDGRHLGVAARCKYHRFDASPALSAFLLGRGGSARESPGQGGCGHLPPEQGGIPR